MVILDIPNQQKDVIPYILLHKEHKNFQKTTEITNRHRFMSVLVSHYYKKDKIYKIVYIYSVVNLQRQGFGCGVVIIYIL